MTSVKYKRKREELYEETLYQTGESPLTQILRFLWRLLIAPIVWTWRQFTRLLAATWRATKSALAWTLRSTWQVIVWTFRTSWDAALWTVKAPFRAVGWVWQLIFGPPVRYSNPRYAEIHALIARRYRRRSRFITHFFISAVTNTIIWLNWFYIRGSNSDFYYHPPDNFNSIPPTITFLWGIILLFHYVRMKHGIEEDHAIEQAIEREREWEAAQRKSYDNPYIDEDRYSRLSDDGELTELLDLPERKRKNRSQ